MKKYLKMLGSALLLIGVYIVSQIVAGAILGIVIALINIDKANDIAFLQQTLNANVQYLMLLGIVISTIIIFIGYNKRMKDKIKNCNFTPISFKNVSFALIIGFMFNILINSIFILIQTSQTFVNSPELQKAFLNYSEKVSGLINGNIITTLLIIGVLVPVFEEFLYRGLIYKRFIKDINIWAAIIIQAILFGLSHLNLIQGIYTFLFGIALGLIYHWVKSIWAPIIIHITFNSANYIVGLVLSLLGNSIFGVVITLIISIASILIILYRIKKDYDKKNSEAIEITSIA
ncbi:hypothetical protein SAMN02745135_01917 [Caloranaerobacter azorensis DSM 13643]|uniref:CAAX prenyl protease 2/Lysostaphin resistance protein A-like domain-containing protein n=1 Tax=Caloranaerobacter azorensis DSM 13643 TaxID=1121264 RepID=A0A1M5VFR5_9FIRM|nr:CPBP family intramembrane glutamic endopeptidase [Caloranaerobacter azorensis]SHH74089.1 hypothetical protein SAMN02745135_01917 [Caloranaerobacter azorensis DSM 13643]